MSRVILLGEFGKSIYGHRELLIRIFTASRYGCFIQNYECGLNELDMRVFVTGATGFLGSHLIRHLLAAGHEPLALVVPGSDLQRLSNIAGLRLIYGTLQKIAELRDDLCRWQPEACIHLAWYTEPGKYLHAKENIASFQNSLLLLEELRACDCKYLIATGTCAEYEAKSHRLSEIDKVSPETLYAASKLSFLFIGQQIAAQLGIQFAWSRVFYVYGPNEDPRRLVPSAILKLQEGQAFLASPGKQVRDYLHVEDVSRALITILEKQATGIYNVCSSEPITIGELLNTIGQLTHHHDLIRLGALPYRDWEPMYICGDNSRLKTLGWRQSFSLHAGLQNTIDWWSRLSTDE
jgi:nucleoside-diphosphate-sugar epimerase